MNGYLPGVGLKWRKERQRAMRMRTVKSRALLWTVLVSLALGALAPVASREALREIALRRAAGLMEAGRWTESARVLAPLEHIRSRTFSELSKGKWSGKMDHFPWKMVHFPA